MMSGSRTAESFITSLASIIPADLPIASDLIYPPVPWSFVSLNHLIL